MIDTINPESSVPIYRQIENIIRFAIASGRLKEGDKLPTIEEWCRRPGVNANTVVRAYRDLEMMAITHGQRGVGAFVNEGAASMCRQACQIEFGVKIHEAAQDALASGMTKKQIAALINAGYRYEGSPYSELQPEVPLQPGS